MTLQRVTSVLRSHLEIWNLVSLALSGPFTLVLAKRTTNLEHLGQTKRLVPSGGLLVDLRARSADSGVTFGFPLIRRERLG